MVEETEDAVKQDEEAEQNVPVAPARSNVPLIITLAALTIYFGFQTLQLIAERGSLGQVKSNQEAAIQEAQRVQTQFKNLVSKTGELAAQGHAGAKMVMEELQKRGLGLAPEAAPPAEPKPPDNSAPAKTESKPGK